MTVRYAEHAPAPALRRHVICYWSIASDGAPHRVLPDGAIDLVFGGASAPSGQLVGVMTRALVTPPGFARSIVGVRFRPGGAAALFGIDARDTRDERIPIEDALGAEGRSLEGRVLDALARGAAPAVSVLESALLARFERRALPLDPRLAAAVAAVDRACGAVTTPALARSVGLTERHLERLFGARVGIGPKAYAQVVRVQAALAAVGEGTPAAAVAAELGYADQSHLIRDMQALAGVTPAAWARAHAVSDLSNPSGGPAPTVGA
jgi:AraC-like DNA-binding protein